MASLDPEVWPIARRWKATGKARGRYIGELSKALYEELGDRGIEIIGNIYDQMAQKSFLPGLKAFGIDGNDAEAYATYFKLLWELMGYKVEVVELSGGRSVVRTHSCHLFENPDPTAEEICKRANFRFEERAVKLLNPDLRVRFTKLQSAGDPYCEMVVELKQT